MTIWRMFTHHIDTEGALAWTRTTGRIAIGWGRVGDIAAYQTPEEIQAAIQAQYPVPPFQNNAHWGAPSLWDFYHELKERDLIILNGKKPREVVVEVTGPYTYNPDETGLEGEYYSQRSVRITGFNPATLWIKAGKDIGLPRYKTLVKCPNTVNISDI